MAISQASENELSDSETAKTLSFDGAKGIGRQLDSLGESEGFEAEATPQNNVATAMGDRGENQAKERVRKTQSVEILDAEPPKKEKRRSEEGAPQSTTKRSHR